MSDLWPRTVDDLMHRVRRWDQARKTITGVTIEVHPAGQPQTADALMAVDKRRSRIVVKTHENSASLEEM